MQMKQPESKTEHFLFSYVYFLFGIQYDILNVWFEINGYLDYFYLSNVFSFLLVPNSCEEIFYIVLHPELGC